ncbi:unnamed protein product, partial [Mesorhabditis spiculigera]
MGRYVFSIGRIVITVVVLVVGPVAVSSQPYGDLFHDIRSYLPKYARHNRWMNSGKYQGDIDVNPQLIQSAQGQVFYNALKNKQLRWPEGVIPYVMDTAFLPNEARTIERAFNSYHRATCIRFEPRDGEGDYLNIVKGYGCYSQVGRTGGKQEISLGRGCLFHEIIVHELMHSVGFWHEHSRADRDDHIKIVWDNILPGMKSQFDKVAASLQDLQGEKYDYLSIMHYDSTAFSRNGKNTIETVEDGFTEMIGSANDLSKNDVIKINKLYQCDGPTPATTRKPSKPLIKQSLRTRIRPKIDAAEGSEKCVDHFIDCPHFSQYCKRASFFFVMNVKHQIGEESPAVWRCRRWMTLYEPPSLPPHCQRRMGFAKNLLLKLKAVIPNPHDGPSSYSPMEFYSRPRAKSLHGSPDWDYQPDEASLRHETGQLADELKRYENIHPLFFQIYDILEEMGEDDYHAEIIRERVINLEEAFVASPEWVLSRTITELRIGVVGCGQARQGALVNRYLTDEFCNESLPDGGRYKKELTMQGRKYLMLIRDQGDAMPSQEFTMWADVVLIVFSVERLQDSFQEIDTHINMMSHFRNIDHLPLIAVGTQASKAPTRGLQSAEVNGKVMKLGKHCSYIETCPYTGHNVEAAFLDAARKAINQRCIYSLRPETPRSDHRKFSFGLFSPMHMPFRSKSGGISASTSHLNQHSRSVAPPFTPLTTRKNRSISGVLRRESLEKYRHFGQGQTIPIMQAYLWKRAEKNLLNREWKRKFVCIFDDGRLAYYPNQKSFFELKPGKEVFLGLATVRRSDRLQNRVLPKTGSSPHLNQLVNVKNEKKDSQSCAPPIPLISVPKKVVRKDSAGKTEERPDCFEIISHDQRHWIFAASTPEEKEQWIAAIERQIAQALANARGEVSQTNSPATSPTSDDASATPQVSALLSRPGNELCADCGGSNPTWVSLNLGVVLCIECAAIHRELGAHISKVRSLCLDNISVDKLSIASNMGNERANQYWEPKAATDTKPTSDASRELKKQWICRKYIKRDFM